MWAPGNPFAQMSKCIIFLHIFIDAHIYEVRKKYYFDGIFQDIRWATRNTKIYSIVSSFPLWFCGLIQWGWSCEKSYGSRKSLKKLILPTLVVNTAENRDLFFFLNLFSWCSTVSLPGGQYTEHQGYWKSIFSLCDW